MKMQTTIHPRTSGRRQAVLALLAAASVLGGCAATHVDDAWQCPLAQGTACASVAEKDPAVTSSPVKAQGLTKRGAPPHGEKTGGAEESDPGCDRSCDPLAWLAQWLGNAEEHGDGAAAAEPETVSPTKRSPAAAYESLRTEERVARIWIAPFVDADGVYREGQWVRAVLEPSRWRLP